VTSVVVLTYRYNWFWMQVVTLHVNLNGSDRVDGTNLFSDTIGIKTFLLCLLRHSPESGRVSRFQETVKVIVDHIVRVLATSMVRLTADGLCGRRYESKVATVQRSTTRNVN
jgi:hypothetical protein